ncbi:MAG: hypothetical protein KVP17_000242, partial [Porospora cf. gigantea B]
MQRFRKSEILRRRVRLLHSLEELDRLAQLKPAEIALLQRDHQHCCQQGHDLDILRVRLRNLDEERRAYRRVVEGFTQEPLASETTPTTRLQRHRPQRDRAVREARQALHRHTVQRAVLERDYAAAARLERQRPQGLVVPEQPFGRASPSPKQVVKSPSHVRVQSLASPPTVPTPKSVSSLLARTHEEVKHVFARADGPLLSQEAIAPWPRPGLRDSREAVTTSPSKPAPAEVPKSLGPAVKEVVLEGGTVRMAAPKLKKPSTSPSKFRKGSESSSAASSKKSSKGSVVKFRKASAPSPSAFPKESPKESQKALTKKPLASDVVDPRQVGSPSLKKPPTSPVKFRKGSESSSEASSKKSSKGSVVKFRKASDPSPSASPKETPKESPKPLTKPLVKKPVPKAPEPADHSKETTKAVVEESVVTGEPATKVSPKPLTKPLVKKPVPKAPEPADHSKETTKAVVEESVVTGEPATKVSPKPLTKPLIKKPVPKAPEPADHSKETTKAVVEESIVTGEPATKVSPKPLTKPLIKKPVPKAPEPADHAKESTKAV